MKGYHYLMRLAHRVNARALATKRVASQVRTLGVQAFLRWVRESCAHRWLRREWIDRFRTTPLQKKIRLTHASGLYFALSGPVVRIY